MLEVLWVPSKVCGLERTRATLQDHVQDLIQQQQRCSSPCCVDCSKCQLSTLTNITEVTENSLHVKVYPHETPGSPNHPVVPILQAERTAE